MEKIFKKLVDRTTEKEGKTFGIKMSKEERKFIKDMDIEGTNANLAYKEHRALTNFYWKMLGKETRKIPSKNSEEVAEDNDIINLDVDTETASDPKEAKKTKSKIKRNKESKSNKDPEIKGDLDSQSDEEPQSAEDLLAGFDLEPDSSKK